MGEKKKIGFALNPQNINREGRPPKGESLTEVLKERINKEEIADRLISLAMEGDVPALKYIYDRIDGRPKETKELSGIDGEPLYPQRIEVEFVGSDS